MDRTSQQPSRGRGRGGGRGGDKGRGRGEMPSPASGIDHVKRSALESEARLRNELETKQGSLNKIKESLENLEAELPEIKNLLSELQESIKQAEIQKLSLEKENQKIEQTLKYLQNKIFSQQINYLNTLKRNTYISESTKQIIEKVLERIEKERKKLNDYNGKIISLINSYQGMHTKMLKKREEKEKMVNKCLEEMGLEIKEDINNYFEEHEQTTISNAKGCIDVINRINQLNAYMSLGYATKDDHTGLKISLQQSFIKTK